MVDRIPTKTSSWPEPNEVSNGGGPDVPESFVKANSEMEAVFQEGMALEREGKLDKAAAARIDARLKQISRKLDEDVAARLAAIDTGSPVRWRLPSTFRVAAVAVLVFSAAGAILESTVGEGFIYSNGNEYRAAMPWIYGALVLIFAVGWFSLEMGTHALRNRYPTWFVRWLIMLPLIIALTAALAVVAPLGWAALLGWTIGSRADGLDVSVISVEAPTQRTRGCTQHAKLAFRDASARVCLDGRLGGPPPTAGERAQVDGRLSSLGLFIDRIDRQ